MNQIERITYMETILNEAKETVSSLEQALDRYEALRSRLPELEAYYSGGQWMRDYDDDCAGKIPSALRRGVLSEDAVYNLLIDNDALLERLKNFKTS